MELGENSLWSFGYPSLIKSESQSLIENKTIKSFFNNELNTSI
jgi:hypothetical protein